MFGINKRVRQVRRYGERVAGPRELLGRKTMEERIEEQGLGCAERVARMRVERRPKEAAFGWARGRCG